MTEWIKCSDRLPDPKDCVLVLCSDGSQHTVTKCDFRKEVDAVWVTGGWERCHMCSGESQIVFAKCGDNQKLAVYWMPLPKPPEE